MAKPCYTNGKLHTITVSKEAFLAIKRKQAEATLEGKNIRVWQAASELILRGFENIEKIKEEKPESQAEILPITSNYNFDQLDILDRIKVKFITIDTDATRNLLEYAKTKNEQPLFYSAFEKTLNPNESFVEKNPYSKYFNDLLIKSHYKRLAQSNGGKNGKRGPKLNSAEDQED
ncbi:hypothetical protein [Fibrobacter succinogenes]|uniref:hypothetical protein n=1 Tax=Fibrobacter succinogenes TaxID=833 RepID=UPI001565498F|nr:hypothetical protein [Fibrobacter succinogenes]